MKRMQRGMCVVLGTAIVGVVALACSDDPEPLLEHGVDYSRQLSSLDADEAIAVCEVYNTNSSIGRQLNSLKGETCMAAAEQYAQSAVDCARMGHDCLINGDADLTLREDLTTPSCGEPGEFQERYEGCNATVADLERCTRTLWQQVGNGMEGVLRVCNRFAGDDDRAEYDPCTTEQPRAGDGEFASVAGCDDVIPGCEAFREGACAELYCSSNFVGSGVQRDTAFCRNL